MRTTINIYRQLGKYLEAADAEAQAKGKGPEDTSIDADFRSGVYLGVGLSNLVLSLMPSRLLTIVELFGYKGDRHAGLAYLQKAGGWSKESDVPAIGLGASMPRLVVRIVADAHLAASREGGRAPRYLRYGAAHLSSGLVQHYV